MSATTNFVCKYPRGHLESIDALRGIAAFYILLYHLALIPKPNLSVPGWASTLVLTGGTAVTIFFVISAFCLCLSMKRRKQEPFLNMHFYLRRIFRIAPLFYFWLILSLVRDKYWSGVTHSWTDILLNVFFSFNVVPGKLEGIVWASWILSVEMMFYLSFPFIYRYINNLWKSLGFFFMTLIVAAGFAIFVTILPIPASQRESFFLFSFLFHLPNFALGMVAFFVYDRYIQDKFRPRSWAVVLVAIAVFGYTALTSGRLSFLFEGIYWQGVIYSLLLLGLAISPLRLFVNRLSCFYGKISYSVYLSHPSLVFALVPVYRTIYAMQIPVTLQYGTCLLLTLVPLTLLSYCTYRFIEQPGIGLGTRLIKKI